MVQQGMPEAVDANNSHWRHRYNSEGIEGASTHLSEEMPDRTSSVDEPSEVHRKAQDVSRVRTQRLLIVYRMNSCRDVPSCVVCVHAAAGSYSGRKPLSPQPWRQCDREVFVIDHNANLLSLNCAVDQMGASGAVDRFVHLRRVPSVVPARCAGAFCQHSVGRAHVYQHIYEVCQPAGVAGSLQHLSGHQLSSGLLVLVERPHAVCTPAQPNLHAVEFA